MCLVKNGEGKTYNGMAIRLSHGVLVSWDGRLIMHCTAKMDCADKCHVYGTFFAAKSKIVTFGMDRKIRRHLRRELRKKQNERASLSGATRDDSLSDDGSVPIFQNSDDDGGDSGSGDDSDCSVDEGIATEVIGERVVDTGIRAESLSQVKAVVTSHSAKRKRNTTHVSLAIKELPIPRKIVKSMPTSLLIAKELPIPRKGATPKSTPAPNRQGDERYRQEGERHRQGDQRHCHCLGSCRQGEETRRQEWRDQG